MESSQKEGELLRHFPKPVEMSDVGPSFSKNLETDIPQSLLQLDEKSIAMASLIEKWKSYVLDMGRATILWCENVRMEHGSCKHKCCKLGIEHSEEFHGFPACTRSCPSFGSTLYEYSKEFQTGGNCEPTALDKALKKRPVTKCDECDDLQAFTFCVECDVKMCMLCDWTIHKNSKSKRASHTRKPLQMDTSEASKLIGEELARIATSDAATASSAPITSASNPSSSAPTPAASPANSAHSSSNSVNSSDTDDSNLWRSPSSTSSPHSTASSNCRSTLTVPQALRLRRDPMSQRSTSSSGFHCTSALHGGYPSNDATEVPYEERTKLTANLVQSCGTLAGYMPTMGPKTLTRRNHLRRQRSHNGASEGPGLKFSVHGSSRGGASLVRQTNIYMPTAVPSTTHSTITAAGFSPFDGFFQQTSDRQLKRGHQLKRSHQLKRGHQLKRNRQFKQEHNSVESNLPQERPQPAPHMVRRSSRSARRSTSKPARFRDERNHQSIPSTISSSQLHHLADSHSPKKLPFTPHAQRPTADLHTNSSTYKMHQGVLSNGAQNPPFPQHFDESSTSNGHQGDSYSSSNGATWSNTNRTHYKFKGTTDAAATDATSGNISQPNELHQDPVVFSGSGGQHMSPDEPQIAGGLLNGRHAHKRNRNTEDCDEGVDVVKRQKENG